MLLLERSSGGPDAYAMVNMVKLVLLVGLYAYCYGMSAVLVRGTLMRQQLRATNTWLVALLLVGLGSVLPYMAAYFFYPESLRYPGGEGPWQLTNPFASIDDALSYHRRHMVSYPPGPPGSVTRPTYLPTPSAEGVFDAPCLAFLGVWAALVTALSVPWFLRQVRRFRPLGRDRPEAVPVDVSPEPASGGREPPVDAATGGSRPPLAGADGIRKP